MTTITVYDPAMCCSTGICGAEVDQRLIDLAADLDWLKAQGVRVQRFGLSREPAEFAASDTIHRIMHDSEGDDLPAFIVDGALKAKAHYPNRAELAEWTGMDAPKLEFTGQVREVIALGAAIAASCEPCPKHHAKKAVAVGLTDAQMCEAVAVGRMVRAASARNIDSLADTPIAQAASSCCGAAHGKSVEARGGSGSGSKSATDREQAGSC